MAKTEFINPKAKDVTAAVSKYQKRGMGMKVNAKSMKFPYSPPKKMARMGK